MSNIAELDLQLKKFKSESDILDYIGSDEYQMNDENPGVCFAYVIETSDEKVSARLIFSASREDKEALGIPWQGQGSWDEFTTEADFDSFDKYTMNGYSIL